MFVGDGIHHAERDIVEGEKDIAGLDGFWGYVYQRHANSVHAGTKILKTLADKEEHGAKI
jgi:hypothetical protein